MNGDLRAQKQYGKNYYEQYDNENTLPYAMFLTHDKIDQKLKPMERVVEIKGRYSYTIYPFKLVAQEGII